MEKYTAKYFRDMLPIEKKKSDSLLGKLMCRPISFGLSAFFVNLGLTANDVTFVSIIVAICVNFVYIFAGNNHVIGMIGAIMTFLWILLDCADGNIARAVKKQPYGEFLDALSSYILTAFLGISCGIYVFNNGGFFFLAQNPNVLIIGGLASIFDLLMRTSHQKFENTRVKNNIPSGLTSGSFLRKLKERAMLEFGIAGLLPVLFVVCTALNMLDIVLVYLLVYNGASCVFVISLYVYRVMKMKSLSLNNSDKTRTPV